MNQLFLTISHVGTKTYEFETEKIGKMITTKIVDPTKTEWTSSVFLAQENDGKLGSSTDCCKLHREYNIWVKI